MKFEPCRNMVNHLDGLSIELVETMWIFPLYQPTSVYLCFL